MINGETGTGNELLASARSGSTAAASPTTGLNEVTIGLRDTEIIGNPSHNNTLRNRLHASVGIIDGGHRRDGRGGACGESGPGTGSRNQCRRSRADARLGSSRGLPAIARVRSERRGVRPQARHRRRRPRAATDGPTWPRSTGVVGRDIMGGGRSERSDRLFSLPRFIERQDSDGAVRGSEGNAAGGVGAAVRRGGRTLQSARSTDCEFDPSLLRRRARSSPAFGAGVF